MAMMETVGHSEGAARTGAWLYLDEITHRALNDYTVMLSLVRSAALTVSDADAIQALNEVAQRLGSSAKAWQALRRPSGSMPRNLDEDIAVLCKAMTGSILEDRHITLSLTAEPVVLDSRRSWQVSLVVAELILNAARHAFSARADGAVRVEVGMRGSFLQCAVKDNGAATRIISPGRGSGIVDGLAAELGGAVFRQHTAEGTTVMLCVPLT